MLLFRRSVTAGFILVLSFVLIKGGYDLWRIFLFEISGAFNGDSPIYWAVSRGILNGLMPYSDLFEMKPPGLFLIGALSYAITDDMSIGHWVSGACIALLALGAMFPIWRMSRGIGREERILMILASLLFGLMFALYSGLQSGSFQTEAFAVLPAVLAVGLIALDKGSFSWVRTIGTAIGICAATGLKEPFLLTIFASSLLLSENPRALLRVFVIPFAFAAVAGILFLVFSGMFEGYFSIYLPHMTGEYAQRYGPSWMRGFVYHLFVVDTQKYSVWLSILLPLLFIASILAHLRVDEYKKNLLVALVFIVSIVSVYMGGEVLVIAHINNFVLPARSVGWVVAGACGILGCILYVWKGQHNRALAWNLGSYALATYIGLYAMGLSGDYIPHHYVFFVPVYFALFIILVRLFLVEPKLWVNQAGLLIVAALSILVVATKSLPDLSAQMVEIKKMEAQAKVEANTVDTILDRCDINQYLYANEIGSLLYGFTKHSPLGPGFFQLAFNTAIPFFHDSYVYNLKIAQVVLYSPVLGRPLLPDDRVYIEQNFTETPWPCAGSFQNPALYKILFRNQGAR